SDAASSTPAAAPRRPPVARPARPPRPRTAPRMAAPPRSGVLVLPLRR
ncbi:GcrA cell cycle regulator, partial [Streptomyces inhibens]